MIRVSWNRTINDKSKVTGIVVGFVSIRDNRTCAIIVDGKNLVQKDLYDLTFEGWADK